MGAKCHGGSSLYCDIKAFVYGRTLPGGRNCPVVVAMGWFPVTRFMSTEATWNRADNRECPATAGAESDLLRW